jgi:ATP-dependent RNA helicase RhlE
VLPPGFSSHEDLEPEAKESNFMADGFSALGVRSELVDALAAHGILAPFRIQELVVPEALRGGDVLAKSPTGSGKTLAFALPVVERLQSGDGPASAVVLVPTRELAQQVAEDFEMVAGAVGLRAVAVYGGAPVRAQAQEAKRAQILIATPGRLWDLVERRLVSLDRTRVLVLDEADRMLDMGFKPQVERIVRRVPRNRQTMLFSATLDGEVGELARGLTTNPGRFQAEGPTELRQGEVEHRFVPVTAETKIDKLIEELRSERGLALVFVRTKRGADRLVEKLRRQDVPAVAMHGDMTQGAREQALERFRAGKVSTLIATDVAARGLDLDAITHVINFDPPEDDKGYVHRVGRTGRAGRSGTGVTLVLPEQQADVSRVAARLGHRETFEEAGMRTARPKLVYTSRRGRRSRW